MGRMAFLVDGFNLYHSLKEARLAGVTKPTRWLDLRALCTWVMPQFEAGASLGPIHYFSALASHAPSKESRHKAYIKCLQETGVLVHLGSFKRKDPSICPDCSATIPGSAEEKRSDVGLAVKLLELFCLSSCESAVVVSGDTDQVPAFEAARRLFPAKPVYVCFPYGRSNDELTKVATASLLLQKRGYPKVQFPDPFPLPSGAKIQKPADW